MSDERNGLTRRSVLETVGGSLAASGVAGLAGAAGDEVVRVNVGYSDAGGRRAALDAADEVVYDFAFDALTLRVPEEAMAGLAARPDVRYVEEDGSMELHSQRESWGYTRIDADDLNAAGHTGSGIHVAILDTGIDSDHGELAPNLGTGKAFEFCSGDSCIELWDDDHGHGTNMAGIVGAVDDDDGVVGVAPDVTLHAVKVCGESGSCNDGDVAAGLEWAADQGHEVANISIGGGHSDLIVDAIDYADDRGVMVVASAGNEGPCSDCVTFPGTEPEVVAVSALEPDDTFYDGSSQGHQVEFVAPGPDTLMTGLGGTIVRGGQTSEAAAHVSGALAVLMGGPYTGPEARERLRHAAEDVGLSGHEQGYGLVDLGDTFELAVETDAAFPGTDITTLRGDLVDLVFTDSAECYFEYKQSSSSIYSESGSVTRTAEGLYDVDVATTADTAYDFRAVAEFSDGSVRRGDVLTFRTPEDDGFGGSE